MNNIYKTFFLLIIFFSPVANAFDPLQTAGSSFVDPWWSIFGIPRVHPDSEGHLIQNFGPFEYDGMDAGDWKMIRNLPGDNVVIVSTHGPRLPLQDYLAARLANKTPAYYNIDSSCYSGNRFLYIFKSSASRLAKRTNRPTIGFSGLLAIGNGVIITDGVTIHYPDGRVVPLKHPDRLIGNTKFQKLGAACDCRGAVGAGIGGAVLNGGIHIWANSGPLPERDGEGNLLGQQPTLQQQLASSDTYMFEMDQELRDIANDEDSPWWKSILYNWLAFTVRHYDDW